MSKVNLMYYRGLLSHSRNDYFKNLKKTIASDEHILREFSDEIYDLSLELSHKFKMIRRGADLLAGGLALGMILVFLG